MSPEQEDAAREEKLRRTQQNLGPGVNARLNNVSFLMHSRMCTEVALCALPNRHSSGCKAFHDLSAGQPLVTSSF
jgi:hypothetical protein